MAPGKLVASLGAVSVTLEKFASFERRRVAWADIEDKVKNAYAKYLESETEELRKQDGYVYQMEAGLYWKEYQKLQGLQEYQRREKDAGNRYAILIADTIERVTEYPTRTKQVVADTTVTTIAGGFLAFYTNIVGLFLDIAPTRIKDAVEDEGHFYSVSLQFQGFALADDALAQPAIDQGYISLRLAGYAVRIDNFESGSGYERNEPDDSLIVERSPFGATLASGFWYLPEQIWTINAKLTYTDWIAINAIRRLSQERATRRINPEIAMEDRKRRWVGSDGVAYWANFTVLLTNYRDITPDEEESEGDLGTSFPVSFTLTSTGSPSSDG